MSPASVFADLLPACPASQLWFLTYQFFLGQGVLRPGLQDWVVVEKTQTAPHTVRLGSQLSSTLLQPCPTDLGVGA